LETYRFSRPAFTRNGIATEKEVDDNLKADAQFLRLKEPVKSSAVFDFSLQREVNGELDIKSGRTIAHDQLATSMTR